MFGFGPILPRADSVILLLDPSNPQSGFSNTVYRNAVDTSSAYTVVGAPVIGGAGAKKTVYFDGIDDHIYITVDLPKVMTVVTVGAYAGQGTTWNNFAGLGSARSANGFIFHNNGGASTLTYYLSDDVGFRVLYGTTIPFITARNLYGITTNGNNQHRAYLNDTLKATNTSTHTKVNDTVTASVYLGKDGTIARYNNVDIFFHAIWDVELTPAEMLRVHDLLNPRFDLGVEQ
jgi:hypothetical protein